MSEDARLSLRGRWVVVTGASTGLGASLATELAAEDGARLVLVARRRDRLDALAAELRRAGSPEVVTIAMDLAAPGAAAALFDEATRDREVHAVVSNAAMYWFGAFAEMREDDIERLVSLNVRFPILLLRQFLPYLDARRGGGVLLVSSVGGLIPSPGQALYSSTKATIRSFVENLYFERGGAENDVVLTASFPGGMMTEMLTGSAALEPLKKSWIAMRTMMKPEDVARETLGAFRRGELLVVPGRLNRLMVGISRILPRETVGAGAAETYGLRGARRAGGERGR